MATPTIRTVAERAGVSVATVSRTLKEPDKVRPETRDLVLKVVAELGFVPNAQARAFRRQASDTVILLVRDIGNPFYLDVYKGVEEAASAAGFKVLMGDARRDPARVGLYLDMVRERHADGLILMTGSLPPDLAMETLPPVVVALEYIDGGRLPTVRIDNAAAAAAAVDYLVGLGHRRIAHISGPTPELMSIARADGWRTALAAAGLEADPALLVWGDYSLQAGRSAVASLLDRGVPFTAVFAANDEMAAGAVNELRSHGLRVPEDVSVVGFDDTVFAAAVDPPLTTIRQPKREIGARAMALMIERLETGPGFQAEVVVPTQLVVRTSTAPVADRAAATRALAAATP
ncbi:LacI family DNA-binding transcriptional regulator [Chthonobacter rhizosphaerae]|uniref:LacI family DNA-binding transcriptional regulator n=1 Tax=Chthonobacter rhizosphaerae TaxID=2735553 RepID=UPI0015EE3B8C|nr:LacI family DNA-binding transcriptional regulator [Chthonobacter rhizosphaerae]